MQLFMTDVYVASHAVNKILISILICIFIKRYSDMR